MDKDTVEITLTRAGGGRHREGRVQKIVKRGTARVVGLFQMNPGKNYGFVLPDNQKLFHDIFIPAERSMGAVDGHKVVAELTFYGDEKRKPEGKIVEILGHVNDPGTDILSIVKAYDLPAEFPEKVLNQAARVAKPVSGADMAGRQRSGRRGIPCERRRSLHPGRAYRRRGKLCTGEQRSGPGGL